MAAAPWRWPARETFVTRKLNPPHDKIQSNRKPYKITKMPRLRSTSTDPRNRTNHENMKEAPSQEYAYIYIYTDIGSSGARGLAIKLGGGGRGWQQCAMWF